MMRRPLGIIISVGIVAAVGILYLIGYLELKEMYEIASEPAIPGISYNMPGEMTSLTETMLISVLISAILHLIAVPLLWIGKNPVRYFLALLVLWNILTGAYLFSAVMLIPVYFVWFDKESKTYFERK